MSRRAVTLRPSPWRWRALVAAVLLIVAAGWWWIASLVSTPEPSPDLGASAEILEQARGRLNDVVGLPVFLVLTKCDLLAQPDDGLAGWIGRIEDLKRKSLRGLQGFLDDRRSRPNDHGRLDTHLWATAMRRPALATTPERSSWSPATTKAIALADIRWKSG
mgnify:CR=1 FL=1